MNWLQSNVLDSWSRPAGLARTTLKALALLLVCVLVTSAKPPGQTKNPYTKDQVLQMLRGQMSPDDIERKVRKDGIDFQLSDRDVADLRLAGANDHLLATLKELAPPAEPRAPDRTQSESKPQISRPASLGEQASTLGESGGAATDFSRDYRWKDTSL